MRAGTRVSKRFVAATGLASVLVAGGIASGLAAGCGGSSGNGGGGGASGDPTCGAAAQPPCSTGGPTKIASAHNYAVHQLFLGDTDPDGTPDATNGWTHYGYDIDGKDTTSASTDVCRLVTGAVARTQQDGPNGLDNSFGANLLPQIAELAPNPSSAVNASIAQGHFTVMTDVTGFDDSAGNTTSATGLTGVVLAGSDISASGAPVFAPSFGWPVRPELLDCFPNCGGVTNPAAHSTVQLTGAYQSGGTFVSGAPTQLDLSLTIAGQPLQLTVHAAVITFQPQSPGHVTNGIISGAIATQDFVNAIHDVVGFFLNGSLCSGTALVGIENEIAQASDVIVNGNTVTNAPGTTCNGISVGLGFTADEIAPPTTVGPVSPGGTNPCNDNGS